MKTRFNLLGSAFYLSLVFAAACNSSGGPGDGEEAAGGSGGDDSAGGNGGEGSFRNEGGNAGSSGAKGGAAPSGGGGGKASGDAGVKDDSKVDAASKDTGADGAVTSKAAFECTAFIGPNVTGEWFAAGFETVVDGNKWQVKAPHRSFVEDWANPNHAVWKEACEGTFYDCQTKSKCAGGKAPDRIIFVVQTGDYKGTSQQKWQELMGSAVPTIKAKFPGLKNIELTTFVRGPGNKDCGGETTVSPNLDKAQQALADASQGFITVSPRFEVMTCDHFSGPPHLSAAGNKAVAQTIGKHYAALEKASL